MLRTMLLSAALSAAAAALLSFTMWLIMWGREREEDSAGYPTLRYVTPKFVMPIVGLVFLGFGIYEWLDPTNHRYPGNLEILSFTPIVVAILCFLLSIYFGRYRATLRMDLIEVRRWPLTTVEYSLDRLESLEKKGQQVILYFDQGRKLVIYPNLSGRAYFLERVNTMLGR